MSSERAETQHIGSSHSICSRLDKSPCVLKWSEMNGTIYIYPFRLMVIVCN